MLVDFSVLLSNNYFLTFAGAVGGILATLVTQQILNRRGLLTYFVNHYRVGMSTDDDIFGSVRVTWNDNPIAHLYLSVVELRNESLKDFSDVTVRAFTNNSVLLNEQTELVGTTHPIMFSQKYLDELTIPEGQAGPTQSQLDLHARQRDYLIPVLNRGQVARFQYLAAAKQQGAPEIWLDVVHPGVRFRFRGPQNEFLGVTQSRAALVGTVEGVVLIWLLLLLDIGLSAAVILAFVYGLVVLIPGAYTIKLWRWTRDYFGG